MSGCAIAAKAAIPASAAGVIWQWVFLDSWGALNAGLYSVGLIDEYVEWLTTPNLARMAVVVVFLWTQLPLTAVLLLAALQGIPDDLYEAAALDGAGVFARFRSITLPLSRPAIGTVVILSLIGGLRSFDVIWATTGGGPGFASDVIASVIYKEYQFGLYGLSTAGNVILFLVVTAIMVPISWFINRREVEL